MAKYEGNSSDLTIDVCLWLRLPSVLALVANNKEVSPYQRGFDWGGISLVEHVIRFALGARCGIEARRHSKDRALLATVVGAETSHHAVSALALVLLAHANAEEDEDEDELGAPKVSHHCVIVGHHPDTHVTVPGARNFNGRRAAHNCVVGIEEDAANDHDEELDAAAAVGAVGREDASSPPPRADERAEHVDADEAKGDLVD